MSDAQNNERRAYYKHALEEAQAKLDAYSGDHNGRTDLMRRIRRVEDQLHELGVGKSEFAAYCLREDERERAARKIRAIAAYERTRIISQ